MNDNEYRKAPGLNYSEVKPHDRHHEYSAIEFNGNEATAFGSHFEDRIYNAVNGTKMRPVKFVKASTVTAKAYVQAIEEAKETGELVIFEKNRPIMDTLVERMLKMPFMGHTVSEIVKNAMVELPIFWDQGGVKKKAKIDSYIELNNEIYPFDLKTYGKELESFKWAIKDGYWIQDLHYTEGLQSVYPDKIVHPMTFLVASKQAPYLCQPWIIEHDTRAMLEEKYYNLVQYYIEWDESGRPINGFIPEVGQAKFFVEED